MGYTFPKAYMLSTGVEKISTQQAKKIYERLNVADYGYPYHDVFESWSFDEWFYDKKQDILYAGYQNTTIIYNLFS